MPRSARLVLAVVLFVQLAWSVPLAVVFGNEYLATREADLLVPSAIFAVFVVGFLAATVTLLLSWLLAGRRRKRLLATGSRVPALLVDVAYTHTRVKRRTVRKLTFESRATGTPVRAEAHTTVDLPEGTPATIAYDLADPTKAVVVDDLTALAADLAGRAERQRQARIDEMFRHQRGGSWTTFEQDGPSVFTTSTVTVSGADGLPVDLTSHVKDAAGQGFGTALDQLRAMVADGRLSQQQFDAIARQFSGLFDEPGR
ncbi:hypothetical protein QRX50_46710 [Amycolatopsis carbonis]|uniref:Uncharacterized protein n=1 Tax=Amycolatopsis carbonis TaxID=715471 RepID=A0A9Y2MXE6_9PSEU|nr:DUF3592 domain-containing protein [Amycolatopsis sp. 2-15]WIX78747.1 hypothetical protein QRX50_46710 [Amycolatopsis sp. 2-15]